MPGIPEDYPDRAVCIMGLGYVGLTLATVMAETGFDVLGVEIRDDVLALLDKGKPHFHEPGLESRLARVIASGKLRVVKRIPENPGTRVYVITVGTPLDSDDVARLDMVERVAEELVAHLADGDMVIMRSTVKLGTTRDVVMPILSRAGVVLDLVFCPERTLEGQAIQELRQLPQIVGGANMRARVRAAQLFNFITPTVVQVESVETAEMIKLVDNSARDVKFALSNEVARICDLFGVSALEVIKAGKLGYPRTDLPLPGPVGGPCLEKDSYILAQSTEPHGLNPEIIMTARRVNERQPGECIAFVRGVMAGLADVPENPVICLAGLAFKGRPETDDLRGTMAMPILKALREAFPGAVLKGYDPVVGAEAIEDKFEIAACASLEEAFEGSSLLVVANNHPVFEAMPVVNLADRMARPGVIYDFWNNFQPRDLDLPGGIRYAALGSHGLVDRGTHG